MWSRRLYQLYTRYALSLWSPIQPGRDVLFQVLFKKVVGDANFGQVSLFLSMLGICNLFLSWPIALILIMTEAETISWALVPWPYICASAALSFRKASSKLFYMKPNENVSVFNLFVNVGVAYTHPIYISVGLFLGLPLNAGMESCFGA